MIMSYEAHLIQKDAIKSLVIQGNGVQIKVSYAFADLIVAWLTISILNRSLIVHLLDLHTSPDS